VALDVVHGMRFLHHSGVIHRRLSSASVSLDRFGRAKIAFVESAFLYSSSLLTPPVEASAWSAPELFNNENETGDRSVDVYSFGVVLWELLTSEIPWSGLIPSEIIECVGISGQRLEIPTAFRTPTGVNKSEPLPDEIKDLIGACFKGPMERPSFDQIHEILHPCLVTRSRVDPTLPPSFICPISWEKMRDPVICADGYSYERRAIEKWLAQSNRSPMTGLELTHRNLTNNRKLLQIIESYAPN